MKAFKWRRRRLTGGGAAFADVGQRAVDGFLGLVSVFPQQNEADLVPQLRTDHALLDVALDDVVYQEASGMIVNKDGGYKTNRNMQTKVKPRAFHQTFVEIRCFRADVTPFTMRGCQYLCKQTCIFL